MRTTNDLSPTFGFIAFAAVDRSGRLAKATDRPWVVGDRERYANVLIRRERHVPARMSRRRVLAWPADFHVLPMSAPRQPWAMAS